MRPTLSLSSFTEKLLSEQRESRMKCTKLLCDVNNIAPVPFGEEERERERENVKRGGREFGKICEAASQIRK